MVTANLEYFMSVSLLPVAGVCSNAKTAHAKTLQVHEHPDYRRLIAAMQLEHVWNLDKLQLHLAAGRPLCGQRSVPQDRSITLRLWQARCAV